MKAGSQGRVHEALAMHLGVDAIVIDTSQRLHDDLGLDGFDLILVALRLEESDPARGDFPLDRIENVVTVRELVGLYEWWLGCEEIDEESRVTLPSGYSTAWLEDQRDSFA